MSANEKKKRIKTEYNLERGESCVTFAEKFETEQLIISCEQGYLWIGGKRGPCFATLSNPATLRQLAKAILRRSKP